MTKLTKDELQMKYPHYIRQGIAKKAHQINRAYCAAIGDNTKRPWDGLPQEMRDGIIKGVEFVLTNPEAAPGASHESWLADKEATGWKYGEKYDIEAKTHPSIKPFDELPVSERIKDHLFIAVVRAELNIQD